MEPYLIYVGQILSLTLGAMVVCGLVAWLAREVFMYFVGNSATLVLYASSVVGTPVHELGHAMMCIPFGHRITDMQLLMLPGRRSRTLGYVEHSYNHKNPWAVFGNLFVSFGPIFSGLTVMVLVLVLCFPAQWSAYMESSRTVANAGAGIAQTATIAFSLLFSLFRGIQEQPVASIVGIIIILSVAQHISLSFADLRGCLVGLAMYAGIVLVFGGITMLFGWQGGIVNALTTFHLRLLSLFCISLAFSLAWVLLALLVYFLRCARVWF